MALVDWQTGVFQGKPRDPRLGWPKELQFQRLHWIGNHSRFLILPEAQGCPNLGSCVLGANLKCLSADRQAEWSHPLELAESFVDPSRSEVTVYQAANGLEVGRSRGYSRSNGQYTAMIWQPKAMPAYPLRPDGRARLRARKRRRSGRGGTAWCRMSKRSCSPCWSCWQTGPIRGGGRRCAIG